jgi:hypothetical protein
LRSYRCYLLNAQDAINAAADMEADDDAAALVKALEMFAMSDEFPAIEVWKGRRLVGRLPHGKQQS